MKIQILGLIATALAIAFSLYSATPVTYGYFAEKKPQEISYLSFPKDYVITGRLGVPLGTYTQIHGVWRVDEKKHKSACLEVLEIDGKAVHPPLFVNTSSIEEAGHIKLSDWTDGEVLNAMVYEGATFSGVPADFPGRPQLDIPAHAEFGIRISLTIVKPK